MCSVHNRDLIRVIYNCTKNLQLVSNEVAVPVERILEKVSFEKFAPPTEYLNCIHTIVLPIAYKGKMGAFVYKQQQNF